MDKINKTKEEWKKELSPEQYSLMFEGGTEAPFSSDLVDVKEKAMFACAACGQQLFSSNAKFDTSIPGLRGWPSFEEAIPGSVEFKPDDSFGMNRTEVICSRCGAHLGHLFHDNSETKTGKHYCINGACLLLSKTEE